MRKNNDFLLSGKVEKNLQLLYPGKEYMKYVRKHKREKLLILVGISMVSVLISLYMVLTQNNKENLLVSELNRNDYGRGEKDVELNVEGSIVPEGSRTLTVCVTDRKYSEKQLEEFSSELDIKLWDAIKGDNESLECVTGDLNLVTKLEGYPFSVSWKSDKPLLLSSRGILDKDRLKTELENDFEEEAEVCLVATLSYEDYSEDKYGYVILKMPPQSGQEKFDEILLEKISHLDDETKMNATLSLPESIAGSTVQFYKLPSYKGVFVGVFGIFAAILLVMSKDRKIEEMVRNRQEEMTNDYPEILNRFALYYTAGMNTRSAWGLICVEYENNKKKSRYVYEEMVTANRRMLEGEGELSAYESFAKRCDHIKYRVFVNLLEQSVKKGRNGTDILLYEEMERARREETVRVRLAGQEAGTKLLGPMFMMLLIVLVIVMVPAFISFKS